ncbi:MAG: DUF2442 domain-containing protein [Chitinivibrionales bacterium]|nr:DUF2442 domain-containing protein [Chitinivibrionales bacterium]
MIIAEVETKADYTLRVVSLGGVVGAFDVKPYLQFEAFYPLKNLAEFEKVSNGGYFVEWDCGVDLSADTIEAKMQKVGSLSQAIKE